MSDSSLSNFRLVTLLLSLLIIVVVNLKSSECASSIIKRDIHRIILMPDRHRNKKRLKTTTTEKPQPHHIYHGDPYHHNYNHHTKSHTKNRYHETPLNNYHAQDNYYDATSSLNHYPLVDNTYSSFKDDWKPISSQHNQILQNPHKYNYNYPTRTKSGRNKLTSSLHSSPPKSLAETIELTTAYPQKLPPIEHYFALNTNHAYSPTPHTATTEEFQQLGHGQLGADHHDDDEDVVAYRLNNNEYPLDNEDAATQHTHVRQRLPPVTTVQQDRRKNKQKYEVGAAVGEAGKSAVGQKRRKKIKKQQNTYEVYENVDDFPVDALVEGSDTVASSTTKSRAENYGRRVKSRRNKGKTSTSYVERR